MTTARPTSIEGGFVRDAPSALDPYPLTGRYCVAWTDTNHRRHFRALTSWLSGCGVTALEHDAHRRLTDWLRRLLDNDLTAYPPI